MQHRKTGDFGCVMQELAIKLRAQGREYDAKVFKQKKKSTASAGAGNAGQHKHAKVKIKSSQRNKAPYHV